MSWLVLVFSGLMESVWAIALGASNGFTRLGPTIVFVLGLLASMVGLGYATKTPPIGTAYAVWWHRRRRHRYLQHGYGAESASFAKSL
ncbi:MAG: DMT family transporter [Slackia sp.]